MESHEGERFRLRVFVVEDYREIGELLSHYFAYRGLDVEVACDGIEALQRLRGAAPDAALIDLGLPGIDGCTLIEKLRADPRWRDVPVIATTGFLHQAVGDRALEVGADRVIAKRTPPEEVLEALLAACNLRSSSSATGTERGRQRR